MQTRYDQFGWKEDDTAFLWGDRLYRRDSITRVTGSPEVVNRAAMLQPQAGGSLDAWSLAANNLFAKGLEAQSFGVCCSFGAPIMRFHSHKEGGAIASFVQDVTGGGKSTTLEGVATIWGDRNGIKLSDADTQIAKGLKLGIMGNLPCTYDELTTKDPELIRQFVVVFTEGKDKDRGRPDGGLVHNRSEWQTILCLASNKPVFELLHSLPGQSSAQAYRVLEFVTEIPKHIDRTKGDEWRRQMEANAGWAADRYLRALVQPEIIEFIKNSILPVTDSIWRKGAPALNPDHRFWVRMIASALIGGTIAERIGLVSFSVQRIIDWVIEYAKDQAKAVYVDPQRRDLDVLNNFLLRNQANVLRVQHSWKPRIPTPAQTTPRELLIRHELEDRRLFIDEYAMRDWLLKNNIHRTLFERRLLGMEVLKSVGRMITLTAGTNLAAGQVKVYEVDLAHPLMSGVLRLLEQDPGQAATRPAPAGAPAPTVSA